MKIYCLIIVTLAASFAFADSDPRPVLIISGLAQEAQIAAGPGVITVVGGADPANLRSLLSQYTSANVRAVISFGVCGALVPSLNPGDVLIGDQVIESKNESWLASASIVSYFVARLSKHSISATPSLLAGEDGQTAVDPAGRSALNAATGAVAVDNESQIVAEFAAANGLPFGALRVVSDGFSPALPPAAMIPLNADGTPNIGAILDSLWKDPGQIPALIEVGIHAETAFSALSKARRAINFQHLPSAAPAPTN